MFPQAIKEKALRAARVERGIVAVFVAENMHLLLSPLLEEDHQVAEIAIAGKQSQLCKLVEINVFHRLHHNGHVHFGLHLQAKALLVHAAVLVWAVGLLLLELADVYEEAQRAELLIEALTVPGRGLTLLSGDVVLDIELGLGELLHELQDDSHCPSVDLYLPASALLELLGSLEEVGCVDDEDPLTHPLLSHTLTLHHLPTHD